MKHFLKHCIARLLFGSLILGLQSCNDHGVQLEKQKVQFTFSTGTTSSGGRVNNTDLSENTRLRISIQTSSGTSVFSNHEMQVLKAGNGYITDPLELMPGSYTITDFMIVKDGEILYATPKGDSRLSSFVMNPLPYDFSVAENNVANVSMQVIDVRDKDPEEFGYASFKFNVINTLSLTVFSAKGGQTSLIKATAELRHDKKLIKTFSLDAKMNTIAFEGDPEGVYTLSVYADGAAKVKTFNFKELKKEIGANPLKITLEPALVLTIESSVDEGSEYNDPFGLILDGTGSVHVDWGDGYDGDIALPFEGPHDEYRTGTYTAIITGDLDQITNLYGFSYGSYISAITGLTNLTGLKVYGPSWGAVPIKVDLSNCENLEAIDIIKYGAPFEPIDLRTDFKLPARHLIKEFEFYVPFLDETRDKVSTQELEVFVTNIYNNTTKRDIYNGKFFVSPVDNPSPETQRMLDILQNDYHWKVRLNGDLSDDDSESGRTKNSLEVRRENWLQHKFLKSERISRSGKMALAN
jgi:hypothetical protein